MQVRERDREQDRLRDWERELDAREQALREREIRERELMEREREIREREAWAAREAEWQRDRMDLGPPPLMGFPGPRGPPGPFGRPGPLDMPPPRDWYGPPDMYDGPRIPRSAPKMLPPGPRGGSRSSRGTLRSVAVISKSGGKERRDGGSSKEGQPEKEGVQGDAPTDGAEGEEAAAGAGGAGTGPADSPGYQSEYDDPMVDGQGYAEGGEGLAGETFVEEMLRETVV
jgi:hypothetical protein